MRLRSQVGQTHRVKVRQDRGEVTTRGTPVSREVVADHLGPQRKLDLKNPIGIETGYMLPLKLILFHSEIQIFTAQCSIRLSLD